MQVKRLHSVADRLQKKHGARNLSAIYGAGCLERPDVVFVFMNPTGRNVASQKKWKGLRAPWLGTKNIWKLFFRTNLLSQDIFFAIKNMKDSSWTPKFAEGVYRELMRKKIYVTNLAKCTQKDARPLPPAVFLDYLDLFWEEMAFLKPKRIITFGNQVSSMVLGRTVSVRRFNKKEKEIRKIGNLIFQIYPVYYPVGQGMRNMSRAAKRIKNILGNSPS